jgi:CubicO group peptidase (beta-lactamase class C family)
MPLALRSSRSAAATLAVALALAPASAQRSAPAEPTPYARALAAGYKAAMYCSGLFSAGRKPAEIDADELTGIYPEYAAIVPTLAATIDRRTATVTVAYDPAMPPRYAQWRPGTGCVTERIGATPPAAPVYPRAPEPAKGDARPWPLGDRGIAPRPAPALAAAVGRAFAGGYGAGVKTTGIVVLRDGAVAAERYAAGWGPYVSNRTWSAGKSLAGTLVGVAVGRTGPVPLRPETAALWPRAGDPRGTITLDHLLRMASGLHSDTAGNRTDAIYFGGTAVDEQALGWPLAAKPGTRFRYANNDTLLAVYTMRLALGEENYRLVPLAFLAELGMAHTDLGTDWRGNYVLSSQVWSTARDLARLGQFWLQDGVWQGKRLLPEGWMRYMITPAGPQPAEGPGYGATLWLFGPKQGLPAGSYAAQGNRGQYVMVVPSERLVVVRRGEDPGAARFDIARFTADVIAAGR